MEIHGQKSPKNWRPYADFDALLGCSFSKAGGKHAFKNTLKGEKLGQ